MNLPSIFKSSSDMKGKTQQSTPAPRDQPPQDMFGLGIQVFKIDSKKDAINNSSAGKARQNMKNFENPSKKSMTPSSQIPKQKKISGLLPNIYGQQQKEIKVSNTRTQNILSKKKIEKPVSSSKKVQSIKQIVPKKLISQTPNQKISGAESKKQQRVSKIQPKQNKTVDKISHNVPKQPQPEQIQQNEPIIKVNWRQELNVISRYYSQMDDFERQKQTKVGRKKNQQYLGDEQTFTSAYIEKQGYFYSIENEYQTFGIENYGKNGFKDLMYENVMVQ